MKQIGFVLGELVLYRSDLILTCAVMTSICLFLALYWGRGGKLLAGIAAVLLSVGLSLACSGLLHWYADPRAWKDGLGTFPLLGCFPGCLLAAVITRVLGFHRRMDRMLDCMSIAGCAGIALGRTASFFSTAGRGPVLRDVSFFPIAVPMMDPVSGQVEYRLAVFFFQAVFAGILLCGLLICDGRRPRQAGAVTRSFLLCHCASQILLDSLRYDSLYFPFNRFVSVVQVACGVVIGVVLICGAVADVRRRGLRPRDTFLWTLEAGLMGCAGYMEYYVQRHGDLAFFGYSIMAASLAMLCAIDLFVGASSSKIKTA